VGWIHVAEDSDSRCVVVNGGGGGYKMRRIFWLNEGLLVSQEGLCSTEFVRQVVSLYVCTADQLT